MLFIRAWKSMTLGPAKIWESSPIGRISNVFRISGARSAEKSVASWGQNTFDPNIILIEFHVFWEGNPLSLFRSAQIRRRKICGALSVRNMSFAGFSAVHARLFLLSLEYFLQNIYDHTGLWRVIFMRHTGSPIFMLFNNSTPAPQENAFSKRTLL